jgi:hypothetical protein
MTREQQIDVAVNLLMPPFRDRPMWRERIDTMLFIIENATANSEEVKAIRSRQSKEALDRYLDALQALQKAHTALDPAIKRHLSPNIESDIKSDTAMVKAFLRQPALKRGRAEGKRQRAAVGFAYYLLEMRGHKPTITRKGRWERLSMVLADSKDPLIDHMRAFKKTNLA